MIRVIEKDMSGIPEENQNGDCFIQALHKFMEDPTRYTLVHGVITGQGAIEGIEYCHAWVEDGNRVIDNTLPDEFKVMPKDEYYDLARVILTRKYKANDVLKMLDKYGTYGYWDNVFDGYA